MTEDSCGAQGDAVAALNSSCFCISLDTEALRSELGTDPGTREVYPLIEQRCPHLFATMPVFVSRPQLDAMAAVVRAVETVVAMPTYQELVMARAPQIAQLYPAGPRGVFQSYDFHVAGASPQLIEINTNAGGALLNAALARAQKACCPAIAKMSTDPVAVEALGGVFIEMFRTEWRLARGDQPLRRVAIVDDDPQGQYLYPEFVLFRELFRSHGVEAIVADPSLLRLDGGVLSHDSSPIDLVYNRLTDFMLEAPEHGSLRDAYLRDAVVVTPNPRAHALYANKRNLVVLSDAARLRALGADADIIDTLLRGIPKTEPVHATDAERLWADRRNLFFKPVAGYGGKAAYRGDKLTRRVWEHILSGEYIAQALVPPGQRQTESGSDARPLKFDLRDYVYDGAVQFVAARLYQGQTTNFRTPGGGFAPVFTDVAD